MNGGASSIRGRCRLVPRALCVPTGCEFLGGRTSRPECNSWAKVFTADAISRRSLGFLDIGGRERITQLIFESRASTRRRVLSRLSCNSSCRFFSLQFFKAYRGSLTLGDHTRPVLLPDGKYARNKSSTDYTLPKVIVPLGRSEPYGLPDPVAAQ